MGYLVGVILHNIGIKTGSSGDSSVGIAPGCKLDDRGFGVRVSVESRIFSYPRRPDQL
jgi:hypothetical protein